MGRSKVDTGYYETMYDRLLRAKQSREGSTTDMWEKLINQCETVATQKSIKSIERSQRKSKVKMNLTKILNQASILSPAPASSSNVSRGSKNLQTNMTTVETQQSVGSKSR